MLEIEFGSLARPKGPVKYDLTVHRLVNDLIVRGALALSLECHCARCGGSFAGKISIPDFCRNFSLTSKNELINLTPDVREDILLALPMVGFH